MPRRRAFDEEQALDACIAAFRTGSYAGTSTDQLCQATGLSRSSLYNTFTCKSDLYRASLERFTTTREDDRAGYLDRPGSGRELVRELLTQILTEQRHDPERRACMVVSAAVELGTQDDDVTALVRGNLSGFRALLAELIARGQDDGSIAARHPAETLATVVHATLNGLQVAGRVDTPDDTDGLRAVDTLMSLL